MSDHAGRQSQIDSASSGAAIGPGPAAAPGKQTLVDAAPAVPVQRKAAGAGASDAAVHQAAAQGTATPSTELPHAEAIQRSFGRHDISGIRAHTGPEAAASARAMGAQGYAQGNHVVLGEAGTDKFTAAHEAAHVVQQRAGVHLKGGVGEEGDAHEQHADAVAANVVAGKSAEGLLDQVAPGGGASAAPEAAGGPVQRKVTIGATQVERAWEGGTVLTDVETAWQAIGEDPRLAKIQTEAKQLLALWISRAPRSKNPEDVSEDRHYRTNEELIRALAGDVGAQANLEHENKLAAQTMTDEQVNAGLATFVERLREFHRTNETALAEARNRTGRYAGWAYGEAKVTTIATGLGTIPTDLRSRAGFIADYALMMRREVAKVTGIDWNKTFAKGMTAELDAGRYTHHNTDETSAWVIQARSEKVALSAGPSATTAQTLTLAVAIEASADELAALAWGLFAIWNTMPMHQSGTHRFHEVMAVAAGFGVPYDPMQYPAVKS